MPKTLEPTRCMFRRHYLSLFVLATALAGCAGAKTAGHDDATDVYHSGADYVRLERLESGAPANSHPFTLSADQLRELLAPLKVSHADAIGRTPVFMDEELSTIVPPLAAALSKAGANQDVTFAVTSYRGLLGKLSPKSITTGRLFVTTDSINLIFGLMQLRLESEKLEPSTIVPPIIVPGTRTRRIDTTPWKLEPVGGYFHDQRADWVVFDRAALVAPATPTAPTRGDTTTPPTNSKAQEIEKRLEALDELRNKGAITEEEYRERRRAILEQL